MAWGTSAGEHFLAPNPPTQLVATGPNPWYDPAAYGAKGLNGGSTNDSAAIQAALNAAGARYTLTGARQTVAFATPDVYLGNILVPSGVIVDLNGSTIKAVAGSLADVIQGKNFLTLTGTGTNPDNTRGDNFIDVINGFIDGNSANNVAATATTNNAILATATTITFTNSPAGFANGDTVLLEPGNFGGGACESVKLISGAGTSSWTVGQSLSGVAPGPGGNGGCVFAHNAGITIQSARGYGLRMWGRAHRYEWLTFNNCGQDSLWTEFAQDVSFANSSQQLESIHRHIRTNFSNGNGWTHRGPHDTQITDYVSFGHGAYSFYSEASLPTYSGGLMNAQDWMSYLITNSYYFGAALLHAGSLTASAADRGVGLAFGTGTGNAQLSNFFSGGHKIGVIWNQSQGILQGIIQQCLAGDGIQLRGAIGSVIDIVTANCLNAINVVSETGLNTVRALVSTQGGQTTLTGSFNSSDNVQIVAQGAGTNTTLFNVPTQVLTAGGWGPRLPNTNNRLAFLGQTALTDGATVAVDPTSNPVQYLSAGGSRTILNPVASIGTLTGGQDLTFRILNNTGGAITTTWSANYHLTAAWVDPAAGKARYITFRYNGGTGIYEEQFRSSADITP
jgi:hypothetical protein